MLLREQAVPNAPESRQTAGKDKKDILLQDTHCCLHEGNKTCTNVEFDGGMPETVHIMPTKDSGALQVEIRVSRQRHPDN